MDQNEHTLPVAFVLSNKCRRHALISGLIKPSKLIDSVCQRAILDLAFQNAVTLRRRSYVSKSLSPMLRETLFNVITAKTLQGLALSCAPGEVSFHYRTRHFILAIQHCSVSQASSTMAHDIECCRADTWSNILL
jgi:hypothetical protein